MSMPTAMTMGTTTMFTTPCLWGNTATGIHTGL